ncbi:YgiW/YdeI family stress tolerance OB fold protein [Photobacterium kishitanii]|uniref:YgiW/YdeI family stress tolerance OB fold protein n=1 Tax=Photobacterium kishitanii TaxID=318456 RepID=UPI000430BE9A|nr:NirD/YgiW/YdeI family stress tolerance protein [Photobacterium kishitanii]CEO39561.1 Protein ygiW [Photobacterium kishitanii]
MKKSILLVTLLAAMTSTAAFANNQVINQVAQPQQQGFSGPTHGIDTVKGAVEAGMFSDDTPVTLTGYLTSSLGGEHYTFTDGSGTMTVEIDHDKWFGLQVTPQTKITIQGEIDKEFNHTKIDVDYVRLAQK